MFYMHNQMVSDVVRCAAYKAAIFACVKPGDVVLDFGAGTGIMSLFAAKAGAKKVYALEKSSVALGAKEMIAKNGMACVVEIIHQNAATFEPPEPLDWIISEVMDSSGFNEYDMTPLQRLRDGWLKPNGGSIPMTVRHCVALRHQPDLHEKMVTPWNTDLFGLDWSVMKRQVGYMSHHEYLDSGSWCADPVCWWNADMKSGELIPPNAFSWPFSTIEIHRSITCHGLVSWFEAVLTHGIELSSSPDAPITCWRHMFHPFEKTLELKAGDRIDLQFGFGSCDGHRYYPYAIKQIREKKAIESLIVNDPILDQASFAELARVTGRFIPEIDLDDRRLHALLGIVDNKISATDAANRLLQNDTLEFTDFHDAMRFIVNAWRKRPYRMA